MNRSLRLLLVASLFLVACGDDGGEPYMPEPFTPTAATEAYCGTDYLDVEARIDALLLELSLEEKVGLMHGRFIITQPIEGEVATWFADGIPEHGVPGFHMLDGPRGVSRMSGVSATAFPVAMARGATWDPSLEERIGEAMGVEIRAVGSDVILAPTINILRHPRWGRAQETYGEDPMHMGEMAVAFVEGAQRHVLASAKHFAANSIDDTRFDVDVNVDERTLREIYLPHFRRVVQDAQVASIMTAYNQVNGSWSSESTHLLRDILKGEWEFQGFVESDWVFGTHDTVAALAGGLDLEMPASNIYGPPLVEAVENGEASIHDVDAAVRRLLRAQLCFDLDSNPASVDLAGLATPAHVALALEAAQRSIVLLKNEGDVLPLDDAAPLEVVVVGKLADVENIGDFGSSAVNAPYVVTALEGLMNRAGSATITHIAGETLDASELMTVAAADAVIIVTGLTSEDEGEGFIAAGDRESLALSTADVALIQSVAAEGAPTIVVLEGGAAITMEGWLPNVDAVMMAWYPGLEGGNAIADVVFGNVAPSGRLPISFPVAEADLPPFDNVSLSVTYGYYHGYRHLEREGTATPFPFGFGLSYTTFDYDNLQPGASTVAPDGTVEVSVDVTNTGSVAARETVQLYVTAEGSSVDRPEQDLRAFAQIELDPAETQTVTLSFDVDSLAFYDVGASAWQVEALTYTVRVGGSSQSLPLSYQFGVSGG